MKTRFSFQELTVSARNLIWLFRADKHDTIGIGVLQCANDVLCQGAKPCFLDYIATGKLIPEKMARSFRRCRGLGKPEWL